MPFSAKFNRKVFLYILGIMITFIGYSFIPSAIVAYFRNEDALLSFSLSIFLALILGALLIFFNKKYSSQFSKKDGSIIVGLTWILTPIIGALPYFLYGFSVIDSLFESYSGFTTTGSSIIGNIDEMPNSILLWRALSQWIGGLGFTLFIIVIIQSFRNGSNYLFNAEFTSIDKRKVRPHIRSTVFRIFTIYSTITLASILLLSFGDMSMFNAVCHSFSAVSTGGFSTVSGNIGQFSKYSQYVILIIMFLAGVSYALIYWLFNKDWKKIIENEQFRIYLLIILLTTIAMSISLYYNQGFDFEESVRTSLFHIVSVVSTTGYEFTNTGNFGLFGSALILILMFIGGCSASSSTGLKISRAIVLVKFAYVSFKRMFHPRAVIPVRYNGRAMRDETVNLVFGFFFLYLIIFILGAFVLTLTGNDFFASITMSAANISNIGPLIGNLSPNTFCYDLNYVSKIILIILMMLGRLEIYALIALFSRSVWNKN